MSAHSTTVAAMKSPPRTMVMNSQERNLSCAPRASALAANTTVAELLKRQIEAP